MLFSFAATNFRSIKERQELSLVPSSGVRERPNMPAQSKTYPKFYAQNSIIISGPNNAGKSNLLKAVGGIKWLVEESHDFQPGKKLSANEFFHFDVVSRNQPTTFEIDFIAPDKLRYLYLVEFNQQKILKEELIFYPAKEVGRITTSRVYLREEGKAMKFGEHFKGVKKSIEEDLLPNQLFLSKAVNNNQKQLIPVYLFFSKHLGLSTFEGEGYDKLQISILGKFLAEHKESPTFIMIEKIISEIDAGIVGLEIGDDGEIPTINFPNDFPEEEKKKVQKKFIEQFKYRIRTRHRMFDNGKEIGVDTLPLKEQSTGTIKFLHLLSMILKALQDGDTLLIDELDKSLHSMLTYTILDLFHNAETNPNNAQLIFVTHDPSLMNPKLFSRDQLYFIEKDEFGASQVFPLSEFSGVRMSTPLEKWYLSGRFGAIPNINKDELFSAVANSEFLHGKK